MVFARWTDVCRWFELHIPLIAESLKKPGSSPVFCCQRISKAIVDAGSYLAALSLRRYHLRLSLVANSAHGLSAYTTRGFYLEAGYVHCVATHTDSPSPKRHQTNARLSNAQIAPHERTTLRNRRKEKRHPKVPFSVAASYDYLPICSSRNFSTCV
jgi:hypothetical protein